MKSVIKSSFSAPFLGHYVPKHRWVTCTDFAAAVVWYQKLLCHDGTEVTAWVTSCHSSGKSLLSAKSLKFDHFWNFSLCQSKLFFRGWGLMVFSWPCDAGLLGSPKPLCSHGFPTSISQRAASESFRPAGQLAFCQTLWDEIAGVQTSQSTILK